jgi:RNA polymerase sigma-70 factor (ECF subfamily)
LSGFICLGRLGLQTSDAADLLQEVFLTLYRKLPEFQYDPSHSFRAWLRTVVTNKCRDWQRQRVRQPAMADVAPDDIPAPDDLEGFGEAEYRQQIISRALQLMQTDFQPATWRACWEHVALERPAVEIARELGISVNAVYLAKARVLSRLRQELAGLLD